MSSTSIFAVIGCHRDRSDELLLQGDDGRRYAWSTPSSEPSPVTEDELAAEWRIDSGSDDFNEYPVPPQA